MIRRCRELSRLERIEKCSSNIRKNVDDISDEVRKAQKALDLLLRRAQSTLLALKVELHDEDAERHSPISLPESPFEAVADISNGGAAAGPASLKFRLNH